MLRSLLTALTASVIPLSLAACGDDGENSEGEEPAQSTAAQGGSTSGDGDAAVLAGTQPLLNGTEQDLAEYRGKVVLVVNTASECSFTPQFEGLEELYKAKKGEGLVILGFPADNFANQEPRSDDKIAQFCRANFGVSFPMFSKSDVVDEGVNPVFEKLAAELGPPTWNFNKYLIDREGKPVEHFDVSVEPDAPELTGAIDELL